ncbi:hypothetical protein TPE_1401 [Treponema pedis str. T A4]|uniref:Uncharacterized protein n=1 Tax=Treponema pedis str. T A4 TaxID=1291379 RepID=S6A3V9_9SPIR|nr:hypothetical protein TPE_1401 [Treponema pedis str. T A4]
MVYKHITFGQYVKEDRNLLKTGKPLHKLLSNSSPLPAMSKELYW